MTGGEYLAVGITHTCLLYGLSSREEAATLLLELEIVGTVSSVTFHREGALYLFVTVEDATTGTISIALCHM